MIDEKRAQREELELHLARRLDAAYPDVVLLTLEIGCGAIAVGMERVGPAPSGQERA